MNKIKDMAIRLNDFDFSGKEIVGWMVNSIISGCGVIPTLTGWTNQEHPEKPMHDLV